MEEYEYAQMREQDERGEIESAEERAGERAKQQEKIEIAKNLITLNIDKNTIQKSTNLPIEMIEKLIYEIKKTENAVDIL